MKDFSIKILFLILDYMNKWKQIGKLKKDKNSREKSLQGLNIYPKEQSIIRIDVLQPK